MFSSWKFYPSNSDAILYTLLGAADVFGCFSLQLPKFPSLEDSVLWSSSSNHTMCIEVCNMFFLYIYDLQVHDLQPADSGLPYKIQLQLMVGMHVSQKYLWWCLETFIEATTIEHFISLDLLFLCTHRCKMSSVFMVPCSVVQFKMLHSAWTIHEYSWQCGSKASRRALAKNVGIMWCALGVWIVILRIIAIDITS